MKRVTFEGIPSGDIECFTWAVDRETFIRITGRDPDKYDRNRFHDDLYDLYPNQIIEASSEKTKYLVPNEGQKRKFTLIVEDV